MAARAFEPLVISREEWDDIFGGSDEEMDGGDSDIDEKVHRAGRRTLVHFRLALAKQLIAGFSSRSENRKRTMKAASLEATTSPENAPGHFITRREGTGGRNEEGKRTENEADPGKSMDTGQRRVDNKYHKQEGEELMNDVVKINLGEVVVEGYQAGKVRREKKLLDSTLRCRVELKNMQFIHS
ncbi:hypothetical protein OS493_018073 [Desmophyllum pertusum]|uniref:Uncharacterized protein n=1 Tax=Desmophyllum pertusum TaxID=174260 RepID=A0A9W9YNH9_9CNID|nr:hypothetical protein OS493_018073 [Desmophyllum pertusum]